MIYSIGIDLIETDRVKKALEKWGDSFADKILTPEEKKIFDTKEIKAPFLAGRFACKEAVIKALGEFLTERVPFRQIEILNDPYGKPVVSLDKSILDKIPGKKIMISLTHERTMASAVAILTGE
jgi:holo-[acyl-carrier protein] synthase